MQTSLERQGTAKNLNVASQTGPLTHQLDERFAFDMVRDHREVVCVIKRRVDSRQISVIRLSGEGSVK